MTPKDMALRYDLAIFDFDGTLVDTLPWLLGHLDEITDRHGIRRVDKSEINGLRQLSAQQLMRHLKVPIWKLPLISAHTRRLAEQNAGMLPVFPGVFEALSELHRSGVKIAVVSSSSTATIQAVLMPIAFAVSHIEGSVPVFGKASRLKSVIRRSGVAPARAITIGDEVRDAMAARKAGVAFGAVGWGMNHPEVLLAQSPAEYFETLTDLGRVFAARGDPRV